MNSAIDCKVKRVRLYQLQPRQEVAANTFAIFRLFGGAKGGGKSYWVRSEAFRQATSGVVNGLILRRTFSEVEKNFLYPMQREVPLGTFKYNGKNNIIRFRNGSTIELGYCKNMTDVLRYQGIEYDFIGIEELTHWTEEEFDTLIGSLRSTKEGVTPNFFGSTNPGGRGHAWVKKRWVDRIPSPDGGYDLSDYAFIPALYTDNMVLLDSDPNYIKRLNALPEKMRKALRDGDWDVYEGQFFEEFRKDIHVIKPRGPMKGAKKRFIAFDYGYSKPSAVLWGEQDEEGQVTIYRELYVTKHTYGELATKILALTSEWELEEINETAVCDPAIINKPNEVTSTTATQEMQEVGLHIRKANNSRKEGWIRVRKYLQIFQDPITGNINSKLKITENCTNLIRTLPLQQHDKHDVEDLDTALEDHAPDALRYLLMEIQINEMDPEFIISANEAMKKNVQKAIKSIKYQAKENKNESPEIIEIDDDRDHILHSDF